MPTININETTKGYPTHRISYSVHGKGQPLVFLHGFCEDSFVWKEFTSKFSKNKVICIDLPGFGKSDPVDNISIDYMADCVKTILTELDVDKCVLIGHSMGGYVSLAFAKKYESSLIGLCLFHSHPYADTEEKKEGRNKAIEFVQKNGHILFVKQLVPKLFAPAFNSSNNFLINQMIHQASSYTGKGIINGLMAMRDRPDRSSVLRETKCPVLFFVGKKDDLIPFKYSTEQTALPDVADIHIMNDVGHMGMFEAPKVTQKHLLNFIQFCQEFQPNFPKTTLTSS